MNWNKSTLLITGAASGIGRALALESSRRGCRVVATDIRTEAMADLVELGIEVHHLDVCSTDQISMLAKVLDGKGIQVDMLINNAGFGAMGPLAEMSKERVRKQFEVNVFSIVELSNAFIPRMVAQARGRIVNIGSISGIVTTPFAGAYCASKSAVHALSEAMRMELKPFGVEVITVQPGGIQSDFGASAAQAVQQVFPLKSMYAPVRQGVINRAEASQKGATTAEDFAREMLDRVLSDSPDAVLRIGKHSQLLPAFKAFTPWRLVDWVLTRKFGLNKLRVNRLESTSRSRA